MNEQKNQDQNNLAKYLTKEKMNEINSISNEDMNTYLYKFEQTMYWKSMIKYILDRTDVAKNLLYSVDPIKEPAQICRMQGFVSGLYDLLSGVIAVKEERDKKEEGTEVSKETMSQ